LKEEYYLEEDELVDKGLDLLTNKVWW